jgi:hypothetical protein
LYDREIDISKTTPKELNDALMSIGATGETIKKCRSFLLAMAKEAGINVSDFLKRTYRRTHTVNKPKSGGKKKILQPPSESPGQVSNNTDMTYENLLLEILDPTTMDEEEQKAVWTLLLYLKKRDAE